MRVTVFITHIINNAPISLAALTLLSPSTMPTSSSIAGQSTDANTVEQPQLVIIANDPILAPTLPTSPSRSRVSKSVITFDGEDPLDILTGMNEHDPLLGDVGGKREHKKPFYRPRPLWWVYSALEIEIKITMFNGLQDRALCYFGSHFCM